MALHVVTRDEVDACDMARQGKGAPQHQATGMERVCLCALSERGQEADRTCVITVAVSNKLEHQVKRLFAPSPVYQAHRAEDLYETHTHRQRETDRDCIKTLNVLLLLYTTHSCKSSGVSPINTGRHIARRKRSDQERGERSDQFDRTHIFTLFLSLSL
jgi:hypothetical protein